MLKTIEGTEETQEFIKNIVNNLRAQRPPTKHVDYKITLGKKSSLVTEETGEIFRNVSIIKLGSLLVAIGNRTGDLLVWKKPWLMNSKTILRKVTKFLKKIQPETLAKSKKMDKDFFANSTLFSPNPEHTRNTQTFKIRWTKIERTILGSNSEPKEELIEEYKTL